MNFLKKFFRVAGPGLITGAADDDPSGIATYSQTGAKFGYGQLWTAFLMLPFLIAVQEACVRISAVTGEGLTSAIKKHYSNKVLYLVVFLVAIANTINIGADIAAMAAANLIIPLNPLVLTILFTIAILLLEIFLCYKTYATFLKWLCLSLLSYPITVFIVKQPWLTILKATFIPHIEFNFQFLFLITGIFGTTISPYMFFWQASQVAEEKREEELPKNHGKFSHDFQFLKKLRIDNVIGMLFSQIAAWSIIVVAATVLHGHGITEIKSATDAAKALEPLVSTFPHAGFLAKLIFAIGIIGLGLLSVPILAAAVAYPFSTTFGFPKGLDKKVSHAKVFYGVLTISMLSGLGMNLVGINPIKALVSAAVINGIIAIPLIFIIFQIANNKKIMGNYKSGILSNIFLLLTFLAMLMSGFGMFFTFGNK